MFVPNTIEIPMLLSEELYAEIQRKDDTKNEVVVDLSNIDPKEFAPENPLYNLAVQRRGLPLFYLSKITLGVLLLLIILRVMYGNLGGFKSQVKVIRAEKKQLGSKIYFAGFIGYTIFVILFISFSISSVH